MKLTFEIIQAKMSCCMSVNIFTGLPEVRTIFQGVIFNFLLDQSPVIPNDIEGVIDLHMHLSHEGHRYVSSRYTCYLAAR